MHILCLGINHHTADVCLRERLAFQDHSAAQVLSRFGSGESTSPDAISEMVILSTCHRVELYAVTSQPDFSALEQTLSRSRGVAIEEFADHLYRRQDEEAVEHLFRVASGLDSLILGEPQILGQVLKAFELARSQNAAGPVLSRLFQSALHTGKRARSETAIGQNPASISSVAVRLAEKAVRSLKKAEIGILGAGEMAELAVKALRKRGADRITVINRTMEHAQHLAERWGGEAATFKMLPELLGRLDILITSTGAPHTVINTDLVQPALQARSRKPLVIIDIAVPRDVADEVGSLPGVKLYDIDRLYEHLEHSLARREQEVPMVEAILAEEKVAFLAYLQRLDVVPLITEMRQYAEAIRKAELEKTLRRLPDLSPEEQQRLEAMTQALVKKLLHSPITRLRAEAGTSRAAEYADAARGLFGLEG